MLAENTAEPPCEGGRQECWWAVSNGNLIPSVLCSQGWNDRHHLLRQSEVVNVCSCQICPGMFGNTEPCLGRLGDNTVVPCDPAPPEEDIYKGQGPFPPTLNLQKSERRDKESTPTHSFPIWH